MKPEIVRAHVIEQTWDRAQIRQALAMRSIETGVPLYEGKNSIIYGYTKIMFKANQVRDIKDLAENHVLVLEAIHEQR